MDQVGFQLVAPRATVEVTLPDGRVISGPRGAAIKEFLFTASQPNDPPIVGAIVNNELRELTYPVHMDARARPVTMAEPDGMLIYRRSLTFLLDTSFEELFPEGVLTIDHSVASGGFYCQVAGRSPLTPEELSQLETRMKEWVAQDETFSKREAPLNEAIAYFSAKNYPDKVRLLAHRRKPYLTLYRLGDHQDYHHGYMVPSTGFLKWFSLVTTNGGFTLRFPRRAHPEELTPMPEYPMLLTTFREYGAWLDRLGIASAGLLDDAIAGGRIREVILISEALHEQRIANIAEAITARREQIKVILVSGPSSSGKTTFAKRLTIQLLAQGISPYPIEMDNFFLDREMTPFNEKGERDFESINALDRSLLAETLASLGRGEEIRIPHYNFKTGIREPGEMVQLQPNQMMILEGIHGLNPELIPGMQAEYTFRIYVSCLTQLNLDRHNRISTTDSRLIRRIVRDARERGYSARDTIQRWEAVRQGEKNNIFPYQENADVMFNSALVYELSALRSLAEPLLRQVPWGTPEYVEAKRLLALLEWFLPVDPDLIPDNSILREFIGGSILKDFNLWQNQ